MFYGSFAILMWKCGTQLNKEAIYKPIGDDEREKMKRMKDKGSKYSKILY